MIVPFDKQRELFMETERLRAENGGKQEHPVGGGGGGAGTKTIFVASSRA